MFGIIFVEGITHFLFISNLCQSTFALLFLPYTVLSQSVLSELRFIPCHQNFAHYPLFVFCEVPDIEHLCEKHCQLEEFINKEMNRLRTEGQLCRTVLPLYKIEKNAFKVSFLNARSLHKHINDICTDLNYSSSDVCIFSKTRLSHSDIDNDYSLDGYSLFRNVTLHRISSIMVMTRACYFSTIDKRNFR